VSRRDGKCRKEGGKSQNPGQQRVYPIKQYRLSVTALPYLSQDKILQLQGGRTDGCLDMLD